MKKTNIRYKKKEPSEKGKQMFINYNQTTGIKGLEIIKSVMAEESQKDKSVRNYEIVLDLGNKTVSHLNKVIKYADEKLKNEISLLLTETQQIVDSKELSDYIERVEKEEKEYQALLAKQEEKRLKKAERRERFNLKSKNALQIAFLIISIPFILIWDIVYSTSKNKSRPILGIARTILSYWLFYVITTWFQVSKYGYDGEAMMTEYMPNALVNFIFLAVMLSLVVNMFWQFVFVFGEGHFIGKLYSGGGSARSNSGYANIDEALNFRDGVLNQQTTREKSVELAKTGFMNDSMIRNMSEQSDNYKEAMGFLDGQLAQQSTRGKYNMLKGMFGN